MRLLGSRAEMPAVADDGNLLKQAGSDPLRFAPSMMMKKAQNTEGSRAMMVALGR
jgi:hypothetical protein